MNIDNGDEIWKPIKGFEGRYKISNRGRVMSVGRTIIAKDGFTRVYPDRLLKLTPHKRLGYCRVRLYKKDGKQYENLSVHRLVAIHFLKNPDNLPWVNHIDTNRSNNDVSNLEWVTIAENLTHKGCHLKAGEKRKKRVFQYAKDMDFIRVWNCVDDAHESGYNRNMVRKVCYGIRKLYKGFYWSYK